MHTPGLLLITLITVQQIPWRVLRFDIFNENVSTKNRNKSIESYSNTEFLIAFIHER